MSTATMMSDGQITVPKDVRDDLRLAGGSQVMFFKAGPRDYRMVALTGSIQDVAGMLHKPGQRRLSIEEMDDGIAAAAAESGLDGVRPNSA